MTVIEIVPGPAVLEPEPLARADRLAPPIATLIVAPALALTVGNLKWVFDVDIVRWALPLLLIVTAVALSWRPKSPEGG